MFTVQNQELAKNILNSCLAKIQDGKTYNIKIEEIKDLKTKKQLGFFFGGLCKALSAYWFGLGYGLNQNTPYDSETVKTIIYRKVGLYEQIETVDNEIIERPTVTLSQMTKEQASHFISAVITWIDTKTDCVLPPVLRYCWLLHIDAKTLYRAKNTKFPARDTSYLNYIRSLPCIYSGVVGQSEAHHVIGVVHRSMNEKPPDWCAIPLTHEVHLCKPAVQYMPVERLVKRIPTFGYDMETFLRLCYLKWREHR